MNEHVKKSPSALGVAIRTVLATALVGAIWFYLTLPAINPMSEDFYLTLLVLAGAALFFYALFSGVAVLQGFRNQNMPPLFFRSGNAFVFNRGFFAQWKAQRRSGMKEPTGKPVKALLVIMALCVLIPMLAGFWGVPMLHAKAYYNLLNVQEGDFAAEVSEVSYNRIPMLDKTSAQQLGRRALGSISTNSSLVSQFEVSDNYAQINYRSEPVRVSPLEYGDLVKWFNNRAEGLPGYIVVNMVTQDARLVQLPEGMKYMTCEHFNRNLYRYLRFHYPTFMFGDVNFEIDEDGTPWWVCSREVHTISLFNGVDVRGAVMVNAITGEHAYYEQVPEWVDRVYEADMLVEQYDYHGMYVNGWLNSWLGQKGVTVTTDGYNYIAMNDDVYMYTGVTSAGSDESNVGFILVNQRTKDARYYHVTGAEEYSAMNSAQGAVQHLHYSATFPILLNISGEPTYFMALKDSADLVKMYSMVNVSDYQITATGSTVAECQAAYEQILRHNGINVTAPVEEFLTQTVSGRIDDLRTAVIDGNTRYYIRLSGKPEYYCISAAAQPSVVILNNGDRVTVEYRTPEETSSTEILEAVSITK